MPRSPSLLLPLLLLLSITIVDPTGAQQSIPYGYQLLTNPQVSGGLLISQKSGVTAATPLLINGFGEIATFFDRRPTAFGGFRDVYQDQRAEAAFQGSSRGAPIRGVGFAIVMGGTGTVGFAFDSPHTIAQTLPHLLQLVAPLVGPSGQDPTRALNWRVVPFPDGSGQMELPDGWHFTFAQKGMVAAMGPQGIIERAVSTPVMSRAGAAQTARMFPTLPVVGPVLDPTDPASALVGVWGYNALMSQQSGHPPARILRVIETSPVALQVPGLTQAAYVHFEYEMGGERYRGLALAILGAIMSDGRWLFYQTYVSSPAQSFAQNLPVLVRIWNSALTARHVIQERLDNALNSLREAGEIWRQTTQNRNRALDRTQDNWTEVFRGTRVIEDTRTSTRADAPLAYSADIVQHLNQQEGYERYREIPLRDLNAGR